MKLLLDQGVSRSAAALLRASHLEAVHTGEIGLAKAEDSEILRYAELEGRVVIKLDADFHTLLALSNARQPSVVRLRIEGLKADDSTLIIQYVLEHSSDDLEAGAMISVSESQIRVRRLPLF